MLGSIEMYHLITHKLSVAFGGKILIQLFVPMAIAAIELELDI